MRNSELDLFQYHNYREYLKDFFLMKKETTPHYSHRLFMQRAGFKSPSYLNMIIKSERNLSVNSIGNVAEALKLTFRQKEYFENLVHYNQETKLDRKAEYFSRLMTLKAKTSGANQLELSKFEFLSKWYFVAIYVLLDTKDFSSQPEWIVKRLKGRITKKQASEALQKIIQLNLTEYDEFGKLHQTQRALSVDDDSKKQAVVEYHNSMIHLAQQALIELPSGKREMNGITVAIPKEKLGEIKEKIRNFRKELNLYASQYTDPDEVYQINIQMFPLTGENENE